MTTEEKDYCIDLLKALDLSVDGKIRDEEDYASDLKGSSKKEVLKAVRYLIGKGYKHVDTV
jgi:hypothetical protein